MPEPLLLQNHTPFLLSACESGTLVALVTWTVSVESSPVVRLALVVDVVVLPDGVRNRATAISATRTPPPMANFFLCSKNTVSRSTEETPAAGAGAGAEPGTSAFAAGVV